MSKFMTFLGTLIPPLGAGWVAFKAFWGTAKGIFWIVFILIFAFLILSRSCTHKPTVEFLPTPKTTPAVITQAVTNQDQTVHDDQQQAAKTDGEVKQTKQAVHKKIKAIKANKTLTQTQQVTQIGQAQIASMNALYAQYFGFPTTTSPSTTTPPATAPPATTSLNTINTVPPTAATV